MRSCAIATRISGSPPRAASGACRTAGSIGSSSSSTPATTRGRCSKIPRAACGSASTAADSCACATASSFRSAPMKDCRERSAGALRRRATAACGSVRKRASVAMRTARFEYLSPRLGLPNVRVRAVLEDSTGTVWLGTRGHGAWRLQQGRLTSFSPAEGLSGESIKAITEDHRGRIWIGTNAGIDLIEGGRITRAPAAVHALEPFSAVFIKEDSQPAHVDHRRRDGVVHARWRNAPSVWGRRRPAEPARAVDA